MPERPNSSTGATSREGPAVPTHNRSGKSHKSVACVRDIRHYPWQSYVLPEDGRKARSLAEQRRSIVIQLATYADRDGSNIFVGTKRLAAELGCSLRTTFKRLDELRKLGVLHDKDGLISYHGTAIRRLAIHALRMPGEEVQDSDQELRFSKQSGVLRVQKECSIDQQEVQHSPEGVQHSRIGMQAIACTEPSAETVVQTDRELRLDSRQQGLTRDERERRDRFSEARKRGIRNYGRFPLEKWEISLSG